MDRETQDQYLVLLQAKDMGGHLGGLSGTTTVTVKLSDVNDNPPRFTQSECYSAGAAVVGGGGVERRRGRTGIILWHGAIMLCWWGLSVGSGGAFTTWLCAFGALWRFSINREFVFAPSGSRPFWPAAPVRSFLAVIWQRRLLQGCKVPHQTFSPGSISCCQFQRCVRITGHNPTGPT